MTIITHVFYAHQRVERGKIVSTNVVPRLAKFEYDFSGTNALVSG